MKDLGQSKDIEAILKIKSNVTPKFPKARPVPYALRGLVTDFRSWVCYKSIIVFAYSSNTSCTTVNITSKGSNI